MLSFKWTGWLTSLGGKGIREILAFDGTQPFSPSWPNTSTSSGHGHVQQQNNFSVVAEGKGSTPRPAGLTLASPFPSCVLRASHPTCVLLLWLLWQSAQTGQRKHRAFVSHGPGAWEPQGHGQQIWCLVRALLPDLWVTPLAVSSHDRKVEMVSLVSPFIGVEGICRCDLIISQLFSLLFPLLWELSRWGLGFQHECLGGTRDLQSITLQFLSCGIGMEPCRVVVWMGWENPNELHWVVPVTKKVQHIAEIQKSHLQYKSAGLQLIVFMITVAN